ncbi:hypothetical protein [Dendrosporobacter sp. 1207_IL3150]|uniref:hypothetical protein n=1 Tax=Dendrosporobacter sp. 1207_IL3150 TaxID=3084054 RepID=UPI002FD9E863
MTNQQLHELAMLVLSKTEFNAKNNPEELAAEMFQHYNKVISTLTALNGDDEDVCIISDFGTPSAACSKK